MSSFPYYSPLNSMWSSAFNYSPSTSTSATTASAKTFYPPAGSPTTTRETEAHLSSTYPPTSRDPETRLTSSYPDTTIKTEAGYPEPEQLYPPRKEPEGSLQPCGSPGYPGYPLGSSPYLSGYPSPSLPSQEYGRARHKPKAATAGETDASTPTNCFWTNKTNNIACGNVPPKYMLCIS